MKEKRVRKSKLLTTFSFYDQAPAHYRLCLFNIYWVLILFGAIIILELILDKSTLSNYQYGDQKYIWLVPFLLNDISMILMSVLGVIYFIQAQFWPSKKCCFKFGTVLIVIALGFFIVTNIWTPWYIIAFFCSYQQFLYLKNNIPTLFFLMITMLVIGILVMITLWWVICHLICIKICEKAGVIVRPAKLVTPYKMVNDDKRVNDISQQQQGRDEILEQVEITGELSVQVANETQQ